MTDITRLYPTCLVRPMAGTYFAHNLRERGTPEAPFVYTNFIASIDGRIAQRDPRTGRYGVPRAIANDLDWHLFLELAAQADAIVTSARRLRELAARGATLRCVQDLSAQDFSAWRRQHNLTAFPTCVLVTRTLDLPYDALQTMEHDEIAILTNAEPSTTQRRALDDAGITLVKVAGHRVSGGAIMDFARQRGFRTLYSTGGPKVFRTLAADGAMHRLYLTHAHRLLAGDEYNTLLAGDPLLPPIALQLHEIYLLAAQSHTPEMLLASYDLLHDTSQK